LRCCAGSKTKDGEIAAVLGITEKTVSPHLHQARRELIARLGSDYLPPRSGRTVVMVSGGHQAGNSPKDKLLFRLYGQLTKLPAAQAKWRSSRVVTYLSSERRALASAA
jgi:predicted transcriptional regulator